MNHSRYGDLGAISRKTGGNCHLCLEEVDLDTYGLVHVHGRDAATVDHVEPQSYGGDHDFDNLLMAHHGCNSSRGTREVEDARLQMSGTTRAPLSSDERVLATVGLSGGSALLAGELFAETDADGKRRFNTTAAFWGGLLGLALAAAL